MNPLPIAFSSQDYLPWAEPVTITSIRPNATNVVAKNVPAGVYQQGTAESVPSRGTVLALDIVVTIPECLANWTAPALPFAPLPWDQVVWEERVYTVQRTNRTKWLRFRTLWCKDLALANRLVQTGSILRASDTADASGKRIPAVTTFSNIPCRVQPITGDVGENNEALTVRAQYKAYLGQQVYPQADDIFQVGTARYAVVGWGDAERIDVLPWLALNDIDMGSP